MDQNTQSPQKEKRSRRIVLIGSVILSLILAGFVEGFGSDSAGNDWKKVIKFLNNKVLEFLIKEYEE